MTIEQVLEQWRREANNVDLTFYARRVYAECADALAAAEPDFTMSCAVCGEPVILDYADADVRHKHCRRASAPSGEPATLQTQKDAAYRERDQLVAALSKLWPAHLTRHPEDDATWEDDWRWIVCIHSPVGQLTWHVHDSEVAWFAHLDRYEVAHWDGHTTEEKYRRLASLAARPAVASGEPWQPIATAPKDGRPILVFMRDDVPHRAWAYADGDPSQFVALASWTDHNGGGWVSYHPGTPTYWMPVPAGPVGVAPPKEKS